METKEYFHTMMLFGAKIPVPRSTFADNPTGFHGTNIVSTSVADRHVDTSLSLSVSGMSDHHHHQKKKPKQRPKKKKSKKMMDMGRELTLRQPINDNPKPLQYVQESYQEHSRITAEKSKRSPLIITIKLTNTMMLFGEKNSVPIRSTAADHKPALDNYPTCVDGIIYNPIPLQSIPLSEGATITAVNREKSRKNIRKRKNVDDINETKGEVPAKKRQRQKGNKTNIVAAADEQLPIPSLEEIPGLMQAIGSQNGLTTRPVFLYRKKLESSDVLPHLCRLFMNKCGKVVEFLTEEEKLAVLESKQGLRNVSAVDPQGNFYKMGLVKWESLKKIVLKKEWKKLVLSNNAQKDDFVEMWGYRRDGRFCLAINIRKPQA